MRIFRSRPVVHKFIDDLAPAQLERRVEGAYSYAHKFVETSEAHALAFMANRDKLKFSISHTDGNGVPLIVSTMVSHRQVASEIATKTPKLMLVEYRDASRGVETTFLDTVARKWPEVVIDMINAHPEMGPEILSAVSNRARNRMVAHTLADVYAEKLKKDATPEYSRIEREIYRILDEANTTSDPRYRVIATHDSSGKTAFEIAEKARQLKEKRFHMEREAKIKANAPITLVRRDRGADKSPAGVASYTRRTDTYPPRRQ